jgi:hypothetical protein
MFHLQQSRRFIFHRAIRSRAQLKVPVENRETIQVKVRFR